eukprot:scaffold192246_cov33-Prasinocladus_malaysianus.AAC.1
MMSVGLSRGPAPARPDRRGPFSSQPLRSSRRMPNSPARPAPGSRAARSTRKQNGGLSIANVAVYVCSWLPCLLHQASLGARRGRLG